VAELTPSQLEMRNRIEALIRLMAPGLNTILSAGDRISRLVEPEDHDYDPARPFVGPGGPESGERELTDSERQRTEADD
jgi:hypothetical protein